MSVLDGGSNAPMDIPHASLKRKANNVELEIPERKTKMQFISSRRGLFKDHHVIYDSVQNEYPILLQSQATNTSERTKMDLLQANAKLKSVPGIKYVKPSGPYFLKIFFSTMKDANTFLLNKPLLEANHWEAKIPFDNIESQGIIRVPPELSEEELLENLHASCEIFGVKRFQKKQEDGSFKPLGTVLVTFLSTTRPDHVTYDHIWFQVQEYVRPLRQCFTCYKFNHSSATCKSKQVCSICSGAHFFKNCDSNEPAKCCNCNGPHAAVSNMCPVKSSKISDIKNKIVGNTSYASITKGNTTGPKTVTAGPSLAPSTPKTFNNTTSNKPTPHARAILAEIINSDLILQGITKTVIDILKTRETQGSTTSVSSKLIKELLITNFSNG